MKKMLGIGFVIIGIIMITFTGFNFAFNEKVVNSGSIQINWPTIIGAALLLGGTLLVFKNKRVHI